MENSSRRKLISFGIIFGGGPSDYSPCGKLLRAAMRHSSEVFRPSEGPAINVVFHVAGPLHAPGWEHGKVGHYSPEERLLRIDLAVPQETIDSPDPLPGIALELRGANALAFEFFRQRGEKFDLRAAEEVVSELEARFRPH